MRAIGVTYSLSAGRGRQFGLEALSAPADLADYLAEADFVVVAVPQTPDTTGVIGETELCGMKPTAFLTNVARRPVVDEAGLYRALRDRIIAAAAIDVWYQTPRLGERVLPSKYAFQELPVVIITPSSPWQKSGKVIPGI